MSKLNILFVSSEVSSYAATGGLADVAESLPEELCKDHNVIRVMPKYKGIEKKYKIRKSNSFIVEIGGKPILTEIYKHKLHGVLTYFIGSDEYFDRDSLYGYDDDGERFGYFSKAVMYMLICLKIKPDIIHLNDWQTALISVLVKNEFNHLDLFKKTKVILTIHNLRFQGNFSREILDKLYLQPKHYNNYDEDSLEFFGDISFMKGGIIYSDLITTVSNTYSNEIQTPEYGYGLDGVLTKYNHKVTGIINGIHYDKFNPETDKLIFEKYNIKNVTEKKKDNKHKLQESVGLPVGDVPLLGVVTRLTEQKGIDLIINAIENLVDQDIQFIILGTGVKDYENKLKELSNQYPDKVKAIIEFNQTTARQIYASSDFFLMPSLFEPCGLAQLYSMRFGTIPVVRKTGGLADTVMNFSEDDQKGSGLVFEDYNEHSFINCIREGLELFNNEKVWEKFVNNAMKQRFSWDKAAQEYVKKYKEVIGN